MIKDNARYTAMRLFQDIEGADVIYINTYAATTPRLPVFRNICSNAKDNGEDHEDQDDVYEAELESGNNTDSCDSSDCGIEDHMSVFQTIQHQLSVSRKWNSIAFLERGSVSKRVQIWQQLFKVRQGSEALLEGDLKTSEANMKMIRLKAILV